MKTNKNKKEDKKKPVKQEATEVKTSTKESENPMPEGPDIK